MSAYQDTTGHEYTEHTWGLTVRAPLAAASSEYAIITVRGAHNSAGSYAKASQWSALVASASYETPTLSFEPEDEAEAQVFVEWLRLTKRGNVVLHLGLVEEFLAIGHGDEFHGRDVLRVAAGAIAIAATRDGLWFSPGSAYVTIRCP